MAASTVVDQPNWERKPGSRRRLTRPQPGSLGGLRGRRLAGLGCRGGCLVGSLADELAELDEQARRQAASIFERWQDLLVDALRAMVVARQLHPEADLDRLALATMASLQAGCCWPRRHAPPSLSK